MAKFRNSDLIFKDGQKIILSTNEHVNMYWDGFQIAVDSTISGVTPIQDYHLTTKQYVDSGINTLSGVIGQHGNLLGLANDDHTQYPLVDGTRGFTGTVSGIDPAHSYDLTTRYYVDQQISTLSGGIILDHGGLTGLGDDDHTQYMLVTGARAFTGTVGGITPVAGSDLTTKDYVDMAIQGLDWQDSVISFATSASGVTTSGNRYIASSTGGGWTKNDIYTYTNAAWKETVPTTGEAVWVENEDTLYVYNGSNWIKFGSTVVHANLSNLQGGNGSDQYYHLTQNQFEDLTDFNGVVSNASNQHIHDDRYYTESEIDTTLSGYISDSQMTTISGDILSYVSNNYIDNGEMTTISGDILSYVSNNYIDNSEMTTISGDLMDFITASGSVDHGNLTGLADDDHKQYILTDGSRGFTATVSGINPVLPGDLATKSYVDSSNVDRHGRMSIPNNASIVTVTFADVGNLNYTISTTLENITDSPPSIYMGIVYARTSSSFSVLLIGDTDSSNYVLNWAIFTDAI